MAPTSTTTYAVPSQARGLPSIRDLFPTLDATPYNVRDASRASSILSSASSSPGFAYSNGQQQHQQPASLHNYTLASSSGFNAQQRQPVVPVPSPKQCLVPPVSDVQSEIQSLVDVILQVQKDLDKSRDLSHVPKSLISSCCVKAQRLQTIFDQWSVEKDQADRISQKATKAVQSMEEQAVKALTSMNETHQSGVTSPLSAPTSLISSPVCLKRKHPQSLDGYCDYSGKRQRNQPVTVTVPQQSRAYSLCFTPRTAPSTTPVPVQAGGPGSELPSLNGPIPYKCMHCQSKDTPEWRRGPEGERTLCNACGLFYAKLCRKYGELKAKEVMEQRRVRGMETDRRVSISSAPALSP